MKSFQLLALVSLMFPFFYVFAAEGVEPEIGSYESYVDSVKKFCELRDEKKTIPWVVGALDQSLIAYNRTLYPDIVDPASDEKFKEMIDSIKGNKDELNGQIALLSQSLPLGSVIEKSAAVYKERMNTLYACAILNTKLRIHNNTIKNFPSSGSNVGKTLEKTTAQIKRRFWEMGCRDVSQTNETSDLSFKKRLIDGSTLEYCNYRHYLYYVDFSVKNRLGEIIAAEEKQRSQNSDDASSRFPSTESLASGLADVASRVANEIDRTRQVFSDAFDAYTEFERHYASHILMVMIEDRYELTRTFLRETMNPIGQAIYLACNAQSTGK